MQISLYLVLSNLLTNLLQFTFGENQLGLIQGKTHSLKSSNSNIKTH